MARKASIGDILEISTPAGLAFAQFIHRHPQDGDLIRVLPGLHDRRPERFAVDEDERFLLFYPIDVALRHRLVEIVGREEVPARLRRFPLMRNTRQIGHGGRTKNWWLWDGENHWPVDALTPEQQRLSLAAGWSHPLLLERIVSGWRPEDEFEDVHPDAGTGGVSEQGGDEAGPEGHNGDEAGPEGQVLRRMEEDGLDLTEPHTITHFIYARSRRRARRFAASLSDPQTVTTVDSAASGDSWLVRVTHSLVLSADTLAELRASMTQLADRARVEYDGWEVEVPVEE